MLSPKVDLFCTFNIFVAFGAHLYVRILPLFLEIIKNKYSLSDRYHEELFGIFRVGVRNCIV